VRSTGLSFAAHQIGTHRMGTDPGTSVVDVALKAHDVPNLYLVSDEAAGGIVRFVESGGTLVMSFFSGIVDQAEHIRLGGYPKPFIDLLGVRVMDFHPLTIDQEVELEFNDGKRARGELWSEHIELAGAEAVARFSSSELAGRPAITRHAAGSGRAYYLGTRPDARTMERLLQMACADAGVEPAAEMPQGVEAVRRQGRGRSFLFVLNHRLVDGSDLRPGLMRLPPRAVAVIREGW